VARQAGRGCPGAATAGSTMPSIWPRSPRSATGTARATPTTTETGRRQDPQRSPARTEAAGQRRHLRLLPSRCPACRSQRPGPGRATGERLCRQRGRLTPQAPALRTSHSRAWPPPYDRRPHSSARPHQCPGQSRPFLDRCQPADGDAAGPGGAPAAKRGRTIWRCGKTTATLLREEGHRPSWPSPNTRPTQASYGAFPA